MYQLNVDYNCHKSRPHVKGHILLKFKCCSIFYQHDSNGKFNCLKEQKIAYHPYLVSQTHHVCNLIFISRCVI